MALCGTSSVHPRPHFEVRAARKLRVSDASDMIVIEAGGPKADQRLARFSRLPKEPNEYSVYRYRHDHQLRTRYILA